jgi:hippurate hydrolase
MKLTARISCTRLVPAFCVLLGSTWFGLAPDTAAQQAPSADAIKALKERIDKEYAQLDTLFKQLHAHPELALQEEKTSARLAQELKKAGFMVTEKIGGTGVVALLKNGPGPTVMVRADMDGLPIVEKTEIPYASKDVGRDPQGKEVGTMHACGHDVNMTCLIGTARTLVGMKDKWSGTLMFIGQPAEETGQGARMMLEDGLFKKFGKPDFALALHCDSRYAAGTINYREGQMQANVDSMDITVKGKGGHGAAPHKTIDPVVLAAKIVLELQTLVSREQDPTVPAVITVGSIHGGTKYNIIPNDVHLQLTIRTVNDVSRKHILEGIVRITKAAALGANAPEPVIQHQPGMFTPSLYNDPKLTKKMVAHFADLLGKEKVIERGMSMGGEDFSQFVNAGVPGFYYHLGCSPPAKVAAAAKGGPPLPSVHSDTFYALPEPTIKTGVFTMTSAVLHLVGAKN